jgi:energy-coupling factor transporter ATP-binding protein EcfA2
MLGDGDLRLGRMQHHEDVGVWLRTEEILTKHLAVLGMTGSGKSNALKHLLRELSPSKNDLRVFVIDTHGEYAAEAANIDPGYQVIDVAIPDKVDLLDWEMLNAQFGVDRRSPKVMQSLRGAADETYPDDAVATLRHDTNDVVLEIADAIEANPDGFCFGAEEPRLVVAATGDDATFEQAGLYVLDLRETETFAVRSKKCAVLAERVFTEAKTFGGSRPALLVVDEAHNYIPERTTGFMAETTRQGSFGALTVIAVEGRKFNVGLVVSSQRPSRIAKDVLAQMNSQLIFRLANLEDLSYVRESFEAAGSAFLDELPTLDTGVCLCAGTMVAMPVRCRVPLFAHRERTRLPVLVSAEQQAELARRVREVLPEARLTLDEPAHIVVTHAQAEATLHTDDGMSLLEVSSSDPELAERIRTAVLGILADEGKEESH